MKWPTNAANLWEIDPFLMSASEAKVTKSEDSTYEIVLAKPLSGQHTILLRAIRNENSDNASYQIGLPSFDQSVSYPTLIAIGDRMNSLTSVVNAQDLGIRVDAQDVFEQFEWIPNRDRFRLQFFEIRPGAESDTIQLRTKIYTQEIDVDTHVESVIANQVISVRQILNLRIDKEAMGQLRLRLPSSANTQIQLTDDSVTALDSTIYELEKQRISDLRFQPSLIGQKSIVVRYEIPIRDAAGEISLPIATIVGHEFSEVYFDVDTKMTNPMSPSLMRTVIPNGQSNFLQLAVSSSGEMNTPIRSHW